MRKFFLFLLLIGLLGYFVWPTEYKEYAPGESPYAEQIGNVASREHRITGEVFVKQGVDKWKKVNVRRPELLRPDITGPTSSPRVDQNAVQQQKNTINDMQSAADAAAKDAQSAVQK